MKVPFNSGFHSYRDKILHVESPRGSQNTAKLNAELRGAKRNRTPCLNICGQSTVCCLSNRIMLSPTDSDSDFVVVCLVIAM